MFQPVALWPPQWQAVPTAEPAPTAKPAAAAAATITAKPAPASMVADDWSWIAEQLDAEGLRLTDPDDWFALQRFATLTGEK